MKIILIRHGESLGNTDETYYQYPDVANILSPKGVQQCMDLSTKIEKVLEPDFYRAHTTVIASQLHRAQITAKIVTANLHYPIVIDNRINEVYHCARQQPAETHKEIIHRVKSLVNDYHFNLILFTHGMLMKALDPEKGEVQNCEMRVYDRQDFIERLLRANYELA